MYYKYNKTISMIFSVGLIAVLIVLDQLTKLLAVKNLMNQDDIILIPGILQFHYLENTGAAFSLLEGKQSLFAVATPVLLFIMAYILFEMPRQKKFVYLDYIIVFLFAGAIGNYIDRVTNNYVVDFIYFSLINFPVFNVADCYVTVAVIVLLVLVLFYYKDEDLEEIKQSLLLKK
ncbi:signal peptidase II [Pseudobutyrivibrio xylanivorans]|uniref:Lipoprotein signal peptidase n=1 Tax=Pseudobutyrivibrio xylanivorans TaxID=185007 RepID=A0A5P6VT72_PSEXY|nr:signal peptidase II [Pseudobutyrivibrio xylanivorans]QFJ55612.1 signal peptidase II [Pseudobutyrivibrio xylanivorans]